MKIAVFSDSHGNIAGMARAAETSKPDIIVHLGDYDTDCRVLKKYSVPVYSVRGNCDPGSDAPLSLTENIAGKKFFITHGHMHHVKMDYDYIINVAMLMEADVVLFGHTHIPYYEKRNGIYIINPGSVGTGSGTGYGIITIDDDGTLRYERKRC